MRLIRRLARPNREQKQEQKNAEDEKTGGHGYFPSWLTSWNI